MIAQAPSHPAPDIHFARGHGELPLIVVYREHGRAVHRKAHWTRDGHGDAAGDGAIHRDRDWEGKGIRREGAREYAIPKASHACGSPHVPTLHACSLGPHAHARTLVGGGREGFNVVDRRVRRGQRVGREWRLPDEVLVHTVPGDALAGVIARCTASDAGPARRAWHAQQRVVEAGRAIRDDHQEVGVAVDLGCISGQSQWKTESRIADRRIP